MRTYDDLGSIMLPRPKGTLSEIALGCAELRSVAPIAFEIAPNCARSCALCFGTNKRHETVSRNCEVFRGSWNLRSAWQGTRNRFGRFPHTSQVRSKMRPFPQKALASSKSARISRLSKEKRKGRYRNFCSKEVPGICGSRLSFLCAPVVGCLVASFYFLKAAMCCHLRCRRAARWRFP